MNTQYYSTVEYYCLGRIFYYIFAWFAESYKIPMCTIPVILKAYVTLDISIFAVSKR